MERHRNIFVIFAGMRVNFARVVVALAWLVRECGGYSNAAGSCTTPGHGGNSYSSSVSISAPASAAADSTVSVTISGSGFKGFVLKVNSGASITSYPSGTQAKSCSGYAAATHNSAALKTSKTFSVQMPSTGTVSVSGTIVSSYNSFFYLTTHKIAV
eukprot:COSAG05_NODE_7373_length_820_cov_1.423024_1_plen_156_part_10